MDKTKKDIFGLKQKKLTSPPKSTHPNESWYEIYA